MPRSKASNPSPKQEMSLREKLESGRRFSSLVNWGVAFGMFALLAPNLGVKGALTIFPAILAVLLIARVWEKRALTRQLSGDLDDGLAYRDDLTGLPNRRHFLEELYACLSHPIGRDEFSALFFLDLDKFKAINDALGHLAGDRFLLEISSRMQRCLGPDALLARFAGDEFTILVKSVKSREEVVALADRIMRQFDAQVEIDGEKVWAFASMGIAMVRSPRPSIDDFLNMADAALYRAKVEGRGRYVLFEPNLPIPAARPMSLDGDIRQAVEKRQFVLHYQPIMSIDNQTVAGFEALVRWAHPKYGLLNPADFIGLAEETGVINSLGDWVIETACERLSVWQGLYGDGLTISVNLSALQFRQRDLLSHIAFSSDRVGLARGSLQLEITETVLMRDDETTARALEALRERGFAIVIDDFGVGYSSLSYLRRFPVDVLKLDQSFISELDDDRSRALTAGIIQLGHSLGVPVVAEGIETERQLEFLREAGCDLGQGFLLGRPMTEKQLLEVATIDGLTTLSDEVRQAPVMAYAPSGV